MNKIIEMAFSFTISLWINLMGGSCWKVGCTNIEFCIFVLFALSFIFKIGSCYAAQVVLELTM